LELNRGRRAGLVLSTLRRNPACHKKHVGLVLALLGATVLSVNAKLRESFSAACLKIMLIAVPLLSLSMVLQQQAYDLLGQACGRQGFMFLPRI